MHSGVISDFHFSFALGKNHSQSVFSISICFYCFKAKCPHYVCEFIYLINMISWYKKQNKQVCCLTE